MDAYIIISDLCQKLKMLRNYDKQMSLNKESALFFVCLNPPFYLKFTSRSLRSFILEKGSTRFSKNSTAKISSLFLYPLDLESKSK